ncbi:MAG: hypothetical protein IJ769_11155 [Clostridia bacterium]|nr:hypothetical protein [Clostridia bacterium]
MDNTLCSAGRCHQGEFERRYLDALRAETALMATLPSIDPSSCFADQLYDDRAWFEQATALLRQGSEAGEPNMMFLYARYCHFSFLYAQLSGDILDEWDTAEAILGETLEDYDANAQRPHIQREIARRYLDAAAGSPLAALWCAYCHDVEKPGFADKFIPAAWRAKHIAIAGDTALPGQSILTEAFFALRHQAHEASLSEDYAAAYYPGDEEALPNPDWETLRYRINELAEYMLRLGMNGIGAEKPLNNLWRTARMALGSAVTEEAEQWRLWLRKTQGKNGPDA